MNIHSFVHFFIILCRYSNIWYYNKKNLLLYTSNIKFFKCDEFEKLFTIFLLEGTQACVAYSYVLLFGTTFMKQNHNIKFFQEIPKEIKLGIIFNHK